MEQYTDATGGGEQIVVQTTGGAVQQQVTGKSKGLLMNDH